MFTYNQSENRILQKVYCFKKQGNPVGYLDINFIIIALDKILKSFKNL